MRQVRKRWAMYQNVTKEDHKVNPHPESAEMNVKESDSKLRVKYHAIQMS
jgi:hypothetical protein